MEVAAIATPYSSASSNAPQMLAHTATTGAAVAFIETQQATETPWFCWVAFNAPHTPFHNPPEELHSYGPNPLGSGNRTAYEATLEALDTELGRLLAFVDLANTNVILIGDNGTPGQVVQAPFARGHAKGSLYEGGIHVPMVVSGPHVALAPGTESPRMVNAVDLLYVRNRLGTGACR